MEAPPIQRKSTQLPGQYGIIWLSIYWTESRCRCMNWKEALETVEPRFRSAVAAIDEGNVGELERLLAKHPSLLQERAAGYGEGYFREPYLLWFIAENPIRNEKLPGNIAEVAQALIRAAERERVDSLSEQLDYALGLVCSGRVPRECGLQLKLIDVLVSAKADPAGAVLPALAHRELAAVERLLERGAPLTLPVAVCTGRLAAAKQLGATAGAAERQLALTAAALYGKARALALVLGLGGVELNAYSPAGFHAHATALHHAVDSGSLDAVRVLVEAAADLSIKDRLFQGTPVGWANYLERTDIAAYFQEWGGRCNE
ncbi:hypothetical protein FPZ49_15720 [Paenibacillus cremeus]|uniref:Ankyrin repeat domain-containing protein n=1 Tax=Paenibacillus cremeus TaxID=2163881 RepID=A0A559K9Z4_9BACL|nr:hypothetical protein FPZ49_15720 [Paenibacillus cremeus]